jgi:hypothetical protein
MTLHAVEEQIADFIRSRILPKCHVECFVCEAGDRDCGVGGKIDVVGPDGEKRSTHYFEKLSHTDYGRFLALFHDLREASRACPLGPFYRCHVHTGPDGLRFEYFWEGQPYTSVKELVPNFSGRTPTFVFTQRFDKRLIEEISDADVETALVHYVPARVTQGRPVSEPLLELYALMEWQWDVYNGTMDQYFGRDHEFLTKLPRAELYAPTLRGLRRIGCDGAADLFAESLAVYAHLYPRVEAARAALGIPALPRRESHDLMERFYQLGPSLEPARVAYIRAHIAELEQTD